MYIILKRICFQFRAAVNAIDFDKQYIVSASGDRTIKVWSTSSGELVHTLEGHTLVYSLKTSWWSVEVLTNLSDCGMLKVENVYVFLRGTRI